MTPGEAFVGYALAFVGLSLLLSLLLGLAHRALVAQLRALGPSAERRAASLVLELPPVIALLVTAVLVLDVTVAGARGGDHCVQHGHSLHLCLLHVTSWGAHGGALVPVALVGIVLVGRLARLVVAHLKAEWEIRRLVPLSVPSDEQGCVRVVASAEPFAFTAGLWTPTIFVSRVLAERLTAAQYQALLAHELGHVRRRDVRQRALLGVLACFGLPPVTRRALQSWELATERLCDRDAVRSVERPTIVASAIVAMARVLSPGRSLEAARFAASSCVEERVVSLLSDEPDHPSRQRPVMVLLLALVVALVVVSAAASDPLHHVLATLVG